MTKNKGLFGAALFGKKAKKEIESLYDFAQHGVLNNPEFTQFNSNDYIQISPTYTGISMGTPQVVRVVQSEEKKAKDEKDKKDNITPKELHNLKVLNQVEFGIECSFNYRKETTDLLKKKLGMIRGNSGASKYGKEELISLIERIENRSQYKSHEALINKYPHTTSEAIGSVLNKEDHLRCKSAEEFIPDFPKDAIEAMEEYERLCMQICKKKPVFYVIADKKDFGEIDRRRDPILLAQSPFGFFWQILGAWDEEMIFLADL